LSTLCVNAHTNLQIVVPTGEIVTIFLSGAFDAVLTHWFFYVTLAQLLLCMALWLGRLNAALRKYDPIFIIPLVQAYGGGTRTHAARFAHLAPRDFACFTAADTTSSSPFSPLVFFSRNSV
jgi:hypothetical protein